MFRKVAFIEEFGGYKTCWLMTELFLYQTEMRRLKRCERWGGFREYANKVQLFRLDLSWIFDKKHQIHTNQKRRNDRFLFKRSLSLITTICFNTILRYSFHHSVKFDINDLNFCWLRSYEPSICWRHALVYTTEALIEFPKKERKYYSGKKKTSYLKNSNVDKSRNRRDYLIGVRKRESSWFPTI